MRAIGEVKRGASICNPRELPAVAPGKNGAIGLRSLAAGGGQTRPPAGGNPNRHARQPAIPDLRPGGGTLT